MPPYVNCSDDEFLASAFWKGDEGGGGGGGS